MKAPYKDAPNPHAWMSPSNALIYIENIKNAFVKYDPQNADTYQKMQQRMQKNQTTR